MSDQPIAATVLAFPERPEDRLRRALRGLEVALAEQAAAVAGLRAELGALSGAMAGLEGSMTGYVAELDRTASAVAGANQAARVLEATADRMLLAANA
ncbi:hypothetical protein [Siccirubricoccus phaeus]|uniref:hypothetical protein n=1 Tax=Siccirubricoccus phaeus TaxID=2595053 RepID=UPI0011F15907|nr:hypothetical protein [Siccirubricoccus phaeus]